MTEEVAIVARRLTVSSLFPFSPSVLHLSYTVILALLFVLSAICLSPVPGGEATGGTGSLLVSVPGACSYAVGTIPSDMGDSESCSSAGQVPRPMKELGFHCYRRRVESCVLLVSAQSEFVAVSVCVSAWAVLEIR